MVEKTRDMSNLDESVRKWIAGIFVGSKLSNMSAYLMRSGKRLEKLRDAMYCL